MPESKVMVFGSFSEDELKSFQRQRQKTASQDELKSFQRQRQKTASQDLEETPFRFGSLDFATLTLGGLNGKSKQTASLNGSKTSEPSMPITKENALENLNRENGHLEKVSVSIKENGSAEYSSHFPPLSNGLSKHKRTSLDTTLLFKSQNKAVTSEQSITLQHYGVESERSKEEKFPIESQSISNEIALVASEDDNQKALNVPGATSKSLLPRGMVNNGNLCFLNATLQGLLSCSPFVQLCQELRMLIIPKIGYPTLRAFVDFISNFDLPSDSRLAKNGMAVLETGRPFIPSMFQSVLKNFTPDVPNGMSGRPRQEDAQEFLSFLMDQMHDELLKLEGHLSSTRSKLALISTAEDDGWETVGPKNKSAVTRTQSFAPSRLSAIFGGQLRSVVKATGNKASATVQPFLLLHLDIFHEAVRTIEDALHLFSAVETLDGYRSSATGEAGVVTASKSVKIQTLPKILILHLMRFSYGNRGSSKLHKSVRFPLELVLGRELLVSSSESRRYELVSTITHHGRDPWKGHYTAYSRYSNGQWLRYDDASVTAVSTSRVLHDQAYVLFYKQV